MEYFQVALLLAILIVVTNNTRKLEDIHKRIK